MNGLGGRVKKGPMKGPEFKELPIKVHLERTFVNASAGS